MIARLRGTLVEKGPNRIVVDVGGIGYDVQVPLSTFYALGETGGSISLRVHTHVREDAIALFGFNSRLEQDLFERLIAISGIGPRLALSVLSGIEPGELVRAVRLQDVARLTAIPGVGKKTAERIGLELKDRLPASLQPTTDTAAPATPGEQLRDDLISALVNLGYQRATVEKIVDRELEASPDAAFEGVLKATLRGLMKG
ncbi:MAG TPA: Holliday junction branch migration protein RuvA [Vicinamibacterales bacterium]|nr:Holliday junction branch migration protein RuvA [Vicinamibacterales bacterium]